MNYTVSRVLVVILRTVFLVGMSFVMLYPVIFMLSAGFKSLQDVYDPTVVWLPQHFSLEPMKLALKVLNYGQSVMKTLSMTIPSVLLQLVTVLLAGYGFARFHFRGKNILFALLIFTIIVPVQSYMIPLYVNFKNFDYFGIGSLIGLITGHPVTTSLVNKDVLFYLQAALGMGIRSGLYIFMLRQFFRTIPVSLSECARLDGCSEFRIFWQIVLPLCMPALATVAIFSFMFTWNDFMGPLLYINDKMAYTLSYGLRTFQLQSDSKWHLTMAASVVVAIPSLVLFFCCQKYFIEGIALTGLKE